MKNWFRKKEWFAFFILRFHSFMRYGRWKSSLMWNREYYFSTCITNTYFFDYPSLSRIVLLLKGMSNYAITPLTHAFIFWSPNRCQIRWPSSSRSQFPVLFPIVFIVYIHLHNLFHSNRYYPLFSNVESSFDVKVPQVK